MLKANITPEYAQIYRDQIKASGITFAQVEAKIEDLKAEAAARGLTKEQIEQAVENARVEFQAQFNMTYPEFKEFVLNWYYDRTQSLQSYEPFGIQELEEWANGFENAVCAWWVDTGMPQIQQAQSDFV